MYFFSPLFIPNTFAALTEDHEWKILLRRIFTPNFYEVHETNMKFNMLASLRLYYIYAQAESFGGVKDIEGVNELAANQRTEKILDWELGLFDCLAMMFNQFNKENIQKKIEDQQEKINSLLDHECLNDEKISEHFAKLFKPVLQLWHNKKDLKLTYIECRNKLKKLKEGSNTRRILLEKLSGLGILAYEVKSKPEKRLAKLIDQLSGRSENLS